MSPPEASGVFVSTHPDVTETGSDSADESLSRMELGAVCACWLLGGLGRLYYVLKLHPATQYIYSDMEGYWSHAVRLTQGVPESIGDTLFPPGLSMMLAGLLLLDPTALLGQLALWLLSLAIMALVWLIAARVYGRRAAVVALVLATVHFPFVHYAGLFLAETGFTVLVLATVWLTIMAVQSASWRDTALASLAAGLCAGLAISFKNTLSVGLLFAALISAGHAIKHRDRRALPAMLAFSLGLSMVAVPLALRCTQLNDGRFCASANNLGMNVLMGHFGPVRYFRWDDAVHNTTYGFSAIESWQRGYTASISLDFGAYDTARNLGVAKQWIAKHPWPSLRQSFENVSDLITARSLWPEAIYRGVDYGVWSQRVFWLLMLLPAAITLVRRSPDLLRLRAASLPEWLMIAPLLGLVVSVFVSISEVRFRVPFDGLFIVFAAPSWLFASPIGHRFAQACERVHKALFAK